MTGNVRNNPAHDGIPCGNRLWPDRRGRPGLRSGALAKVGLLRRYCILARDHTVRYWCRGSVNSDFCMRDWVVTLGKARPRGHRNKWYSSKTRRTVENSKPAISQISASTAAIECHYSGFSASVGEARVCVIPTSPLARELLPTSAHPATRWRRPRLCRRSPARGSRLPWLS